MTAPKADRLTPLQILTRLVGFPTVSTETNLPLIDWVAGYLETHGISAEIWVDPDQPHKAGLAAQVGPKNNGAVALSGHTDVVPTEGQDWSSDPYTVTERDGKFFGRGTCDMKGFDALAIWALVEARYADLERPLQLFLSFDEEVGCTGAPPLIEAMQDRLPKASCVIVGEPTMMQAVTGHKGTIGFETHVRGFEVHSSLLPTGVSAVMEAAKLINWANTRNAEVMAAPPTETAARFDPPFTTSHVGTISGGTANNITAKDCHFTMTFRLVPGDDPAQWAADYAAEVRRVEAEMQAIRPETFITIKQTFDVPPLAPEASGGAESLVRRLTGDNASHVVSYGTEAGQFQNAGYSAVVCGPGDIAQAHQPDEYITKAQFEAGEAFMRRLIAEVLC